MAAALLDGLERRQKRLALIIICRWSVRKDDGIGDLRLPSLSESTRLIKHNAINVARLLKRLTTTLGKNTVLSSDTASDKDGCGRCEGETTRACNNKNSNSKLESKHNRATRRGCIVIGDTSGKANHHPDDPGPQFAR
ncbi:hypothetical protein HG531_005395 [Fusarium graminearum]|nr:hypothetical protein HG531_005395 [Fusarium graminearum]